MNVIADGFLLSVDPLGTDFEFKVGTCKTIAVRGPSNNLVAIALKLLTESDSVNVFECRGFGIEPCSSFILTSDNFGHTKSGLLSPNY